MVASKFRQNWNLWIALALGRTWDPFIFFHFLSQKQCLRPLGYCAPLDAYLLRYLIVTLILRNITLWLQAANENVVHAWLQDQLIRLLKFLFVQFSSLAGSAKISSNAFLESFFLDNPVRTNLILLFTREQENCSSLLDNGLKWNDNMSDVLKADLKMRSKFFNGPIYLLYRLYRQTILPKEPWSCGCSSCLWKKRTWVWFQLSPNVFSCLGSLVLKSYSSVSKVDSKPNGSHAIGEQT